MFCKDTEYISILEKIKKIRPLISGYSIQLPQIVVIGDQSSGKSSVLESLTGIKFPVNSGICTKCPIIVNCKNDKQIKKNCFTINGKGVEIENLTDKILEIQDKNLITNKSNYNSSDDEVEKKLFIYSSDDEIEVKKKKNTNRNRYANSSDDEVYKKITHSSDDEIEVKKKKITNRNRYANSSDDKVYKKITHSSDDEIEVKKKKITNRNRYANSSDDKVKVEKKKISDEPIYIEVVGIEQVDLIVIDLPGLIHNGEGKIEVKNLINKYINNDRTLILVCTHGDADEETQEALEITKDMKHRRLQILTKFDAFSSKDNCYKAIELLKSQENDVLGCHAVICRYEGGLDYDATIEMQKFEEYEIHKFKNIGLSNLKNRLPPLFSDLINKELPFIIKELSTNIVKEKEELKKIGENKSDPSKILIEYTKLFEDEVVIDEYVTPLLENYANNIRKIKESITKDYVINKYKSNIFKPIFFQGQNIFNEYIYDIVINKWKPVYEDTYNLIYNYYTKISYKEKNNNFSKELVNYIEKSWKRDIEKYLTTLNNECNKLLDETSIFGTMNHYLTAKYQEFLEIPDETKKKFINGITEDMLYKKDYQGKILKDSNSRPIIANLEDIQHRLLELLNKTLEERETEYLNESLQDQQIERIFCMVQAVIDVEFKSVCDGFLKKFRNVNLYRTKWINELSSIPDINKYAIEDKSIDVKRNHIKDKIKRYEEAYEIIDN